MSEENKKAELAPESCKECKHWLEIKQKLRISQLLVNAIESIETRLRGPEFKPTLGDYLKLLQMEKEMEEMSPKEIRVSWVNPVSRESESAK